MVVFTTKIPLKRDLDCKCIFNVIKQWLIKSPHYGITEIEYNFEEEKNIETSDHTKIYILKTTVKEEKVFAVRFENSESKEIWKTDCVFMKSTHEFLIQLSCESKSYTTKLPKLHKPHIIKLLFDYDMVAETGIYPITDEPIILNEKLDINKCSKIMTGESSTYLPVVYISYNVSHSFRYAVDPKLIAAKLSGIAHTLVEPDCNFSKCLKKECNGNNAYNGFIGVYFPGTKYRDFISYNDYLKNGTLDQKSISDAVRYAVQQAALNHSNVDDWSWDKVVLEYAKHKFMLQANLIDSAQKELDDYVHAFDGENKRLKEKIESLTKQLDSKTAQLESYRIKSNNDGEICLNCNIEEFYHRECLDFLLNILSQIKDRLHTETRPYEIVENILCNNTPANYGKELFRRIDKALHEKSLPKRRKMLEECGFRIEVGPHDKIIFHDSKYMFTLANSPSDHREADNTYSTITKQLDIYKKI